MKRELVESGYKEGGK